MVNFFQNFVALITIFLLSTSVFASNFNIKGVVLGGSSKASCNGSVVEDLQEKYFSTPSSTPFRQLSASMCKGAISSFAGVDLRDDSYMIFRNDQLIILKIELDPVSMDMYGDILNEFLKKYGKQQKAVHDSTGSYITWREKNQSLMIQNESPSVDRNYLTIFLKNDVEAKRYEKDSEYNLKIMRKSISTNRKKDMFK